MFSGIVQGTGKISKIISKKNHITLEISAPKNFNKNFLLLCGFEKFKNHYVRICDIECNDKSVEMYLLGLLTSAYNDFFDSEGGLI